MADVTSQHAIHRSWTNMSAAASLAAGTTYNGDILVVDTPGRYAVVYQAVTDNTTPPSDAVRGHPWHPHRKQEPNPPRRITAESGQVVWMRVEHGSAFLVLTEA